MSNQENTGDIQLPARVTVAESRRLLTICARLDQVVGNATIDATNTTMLDPFGTALLAASAALRMTRGCTTDLVLPKDEVARTFVDEIDLTYLLRGESPRPGTLAVRQMMALDAQFTDSVAAILVRGVPGINTDNVYPVQLCLNELLQNVFEWSDSPIGCIVLTRWYLRTRSVRIAVVDRGVGIPAALRRHRIQGLHRLDDADVIQAAVTRPQLTSRANKVGGLGLKTIHDVVCGRGGRLTVVSLGARVTWSGEDVRKAKTPGFRGTALEIDIRPTAPFRHQDIPDVF